MKPNPVKILGTLVNPNKLSHFRISNAHMYQPVKVNLSQQEAKAHTKNETAGFFKAFPDNHIENMIIWHFMVICYSVISKVICSLQ